MNTFKTGSLILILVASLVQLVHSQGDCQSITIGVLGDTTAETSTGLISEILTPGGEAQDGPAVRVIDFTIVCEAQATMQDRYRYTSVVVSYTCSSIDLRVTQCQTTGQVNTDQFDLGCTDPPDNKWTRVILTNSLFAVTTDPSATLSTSLESRCGICGNPNHPFLTSSVIEADTHCERCSDCTEGLMRCTTRQSGNCCNYYQQGLCVDQCSSPLVPSMDNECVCPVLNVANGLIQYSDGQEIGSTATLTCDDGYQPDGSGISVVCSETGWGTNITSCSPVDCGDLTVAPENGEISITMTTFLSIVSYTCNRGFYLEGESSRTCTADGTWSGANPICVVDCGGLTAPENGEISITMTTRVMSTATYTCNPGFVLEGNSSRMCMSDAQWSGSDPTCNTLTVCDTLCIIGTVVASLAVVAILLCILSSILIYLKLQSGHRTKSSNTINFSDNVAYGDLVSHSSNVSRHAYEDVDPAYDYPYEVIEMHLTTSTQPLQPKEDPIYDLPNDEPKTSTNVAYDTTATVLNTTIM